MSSCAGAFVLVAGFLILLAILFLAQVLVWYLEGKDGDEDDFPVDSGLTKSDIDKRRD